MKEACKVIKQTTGDVVDLDTIPIDDELTYQLYQRGQTIGTFQFESPGMQKYLRELKPTVFEDLIAMNASTVRDLWILFQTTSGERIMQTPLLT